MFAVVKTGGKQYKVQTGDILRIERLAANAGDKVQFNKILMLGGDKTVVGSPLVAGAAVQADVIDQIKGEKTIKFIKRRRKHSSKRTRGHRQYLTLVKVTDILASGADKSKVSEAIGSGSVDFKFVENLKSEKLINIKPKTEKPSKEIWWRRRPEDTTRSRSSWSEQDRMKTSHGRNGTGRRKERRRMN